jgi:hypothetical protein
MARPGVVIALLALGLGAGCAGTTPTRTVSAASCVGRTPGQQFKAARIVFVGVTLSGPSASATGELLSPAKVRVVRYLKGHGPGTVRVETAIQRSGDGYVENSDGINPRAGQRWRIYSNSTRQPYSTSICDGSRRVATHGALADCQASAVRLRLATSEAFMFHYATLYALRNVGTSACQLSGYPRVVPEYPAGRPIDVAVHHATSPPWGEPSRVVIVRPGAEAGLLIGYVANPEGSACIHRTLFKISLPGTRHAFTTGATFNVCPPGRFTRSLYESPILPTPKPPRPR